jgi:hypothetical protein
MTILLAQLAVINKLLIILFLTLASTFAAEP